ncbi:hypothetical protein GCM10011385_25250 [Nitratireductor aestuarii]|uniref:Uncharacterized protein n=1 Tax=Nitratireductor aestuarii TaxID=1735103 RepID=A0A916RUN3_9HYPH|nr:hypothetical protein [Nitratireductor aestuarii]GGA70382.1 hypothetical protein GCM10011385_25250 [Nitratireductor aestuarii]
MGYSRTDSLKLRLTEREQLASAVQKLMAAGIDEDLIPTHLVRAFYVDMDELNSILRATAQAERDHAASMDALLQQSA